MPDPLTQLEQALGRHDEHAPGCLRLQGDVPADRCGCRRIAGLDRPEQPNPEHERAALIAALDDLATRTRKRALLLNRGIAQAIGEGAAVDRPASLAMERVAAVAHLAGRASLTLQRTRTDDLRGQVDRLLRASTGEAPTGVLVSAAQRVRQVLAEVLPR